MYKLAIGLSLALILGMPTAGAIDKSSMLDKQGHCNNPKPVKGGEGDSCGCDD